jgi:uncharacterized RDD family membrane protein YckC
LLNNASQDSPATYISAATAPALHRVPAQPVEMPAAAETVLRQGPAPSDQPRRVVFQRSLFNSRETPQVVSLDSIVLPQEERSSTKPERSKPRTRRPIPGQQALEFAEPGRILDTEVEAVIYCDAPVAVPTHRIMAAAVDLSLIVIALGIFVGVFLGTLHWLDVQVVMTKQAIPFFAGIAVVFGLVYKVMWCLADGDSAGMRWTHQRLVNFDGQRPDREQRFRRMASASLSVMAAGLGIAWALVDEESLTWHDHISKTFPTPY